MAPAASLAAVHGPAVVAPLPAGSLRASSDRVSFPRHCYARVLLAFEFVWLVVFDLSASLPPF